MERGEEEHSSGRAAGVFPWRPIYSDTERRSASLRPEAWGFIIPEVRIS
jgi:hypothetical protein